MLVVDDVHKIYGTHVALDGVSFRAEAGEVVALLGPNGAGKTTLVSIVAGLRRADAGSVAVGPYDIGSQRRQAQRLLGLAPQEIGVYLGASVRENLELFGRLYGVCRRDLRRSIDDVLGALRLDELADRRCFSLSGGEKRRVHAAIALIHKPALVLLDEPTAGVDVETRNALLDFVRRLAGEGTTVCYTTHYLHEVESLQAHVVLIARGRVVADAPLAELLSGGRTRIELTLSRPIAVPPVPHASIDGDVLTVLADDPGHAIASVMSALGADASAVTSVDVVRGGLESLYLDLTAASDTDAPSPAVR